MVASLLLDLDVREGRELIERLDVAGIPPIAAFWYLDYGVDRWRLALVYAEYDKAGSLPVYEKVFPFADPDSDLALSGITAKGLKDDLVNQVRARFSGRTVSLDKPRHTMVGGTDVVVYRA